MVLCGDAFITNRTLCLMHKLRPENPKIYIENTHQPYKRKVFNVGGNGNELCGYMRYFTEKHPNDRNIVATGSRKNSDELKALLRHTETLVINSLSSDKIAKELQDVNSLWDKYQNVIYTGSITVGVSYDSGYHFDNLFMYFSVYSSLVRDMFQASLRARYINNNTLYYTNLSKMSGCVYGDDTSYIFTFEELLQVIKSQDEKTDDAIKLKNWVMDLWVYNKREKNINKFYHKELIDRYLHMCGYVEDKFNGIIVKGQLTGSSYPYDDIDDILKQDKEDIYNRMVMGEASQKDKLQYFKYEFKEKIDIKKFKLPQIGVMWDTYLQSSTKIEKILTNVKHEIGYSDCYDYVSIYQDNVEAKNESLKHIMKIMNVEKSFNEHTVERKVLDDLRNYFTEHIEQMKNVWGIKFYENSSDKALIGSVKKIFTSWCGSDFKMGKQERKRVNGDRQDVSKYKLMPNEVLAKFIEFQVEKCEQTQKYAFTDEIIDE